MRKWRTKVLLPSMRADPYGSRHLLQPRPYPARLSIVIPMFNEEEIVGMLREELQQFLSEFRCETEVILVNDGSRDGTLPKLAEWASQDRRIKVLHLSRNFGHQLAATAGLDYCTGDAAILIDADLQDPLAVIHVMLARYCEGYDVVYGQRHARKGETWFKRITAWAFYRLMRALVHKDLPVDTGDFRLISRPCLEALRRLRETHRFLRGMVAWLGFAQIGVSYERQSRMAGETKYPLRKMLTFAWTAATSFSTLPLKFSLIMGAVVGAFALEELVRAVAEHLRGHTIPGWTSLMVVTSVIGSALLIAIGIIGEYLGRIFEQSKGRPLYVLARTFNLEEEEKVLKAGAAPAGSTHPLPRN